VKELCYKYISGENSNQLAVAYKVSSTVILRWLRKNDVHVRDYVDSSFRRGLLNEEVFNVITEEGAYWIGFLMADGGVTKTKEGSPRICLELSEIDKEHVEKFKKFVGTTNKLVSRVHKIKSGELRKSFRISFRSRKVCAILYKYGITSNKSFTAEVKRLENNKDFWRGVIDGDGTIRLDSNKYPVVQLVGARPLLNQWSSYVESITSLKPTVRKNGKVFVVRFRGKNAVKVIKHLYDKSSVHLDRKKNVAQHILR
jgi:DNA-binding transcriptional regulator WhiA